MITKPDPILGIEVRHLAALAAIARTRSFSAAAVELGYAQSAVSQQIATLERAVGQKLVERPGGPRPVTLTEAGELVRRHADRVTQRLGALRADLEALAAGEAGVLRIGSFQSASSRILPAVLARFRETWPRVDVTLRNEVDGGVLEDLVRAGELDLTFAVSVDELTEPLAGAELIVDPYLVLVPPDSPLAARHEIPLRALDGVGMILSPHRDSCAIRVERAFDDARVTPHVVFRSDDNMTVQRLVATGLGCAVVPSLALISGVPDAEVAVRPLAPGSSIVRRVGLVWHRDRYRSPAADAFVEVAREVAADVAAATAADCAGAGVG
jgi:DNA-binding transcriptional LysR family regulator